MGKKELKMKFKRNRLFIVLLCLFLSFSGLVFKAGVSAGDLCTPNVCTDCHGTSLCGSGGKYLRQIDSYTEKHGLSDADVAVVLNIHQDTPPDLATRLVLGGALYCTDCHEDHGTSTPNAYLLKNNVNNIPVEVPITRFDYGLCSFPGTAGNKAMGWFCRTCHKDDATTAHPEYKNQWKNAHHYLGGGSDYPYNRTGCYLCHTSSSGQPISCECCHTHGSMTTDYGTSYPCYLNPNICRTPYDRRTF
ncbi:MAG: hypothetical protein WC581_07875 [Thermodesulfovibrionales bacterium]